MIALESLLDLLAPSLLVDMAVQYKVDATHEIRLPGDVAFVCLLNGLLNHPLLTQRLLEELYFKQTGQQADHSTFGKYLARVKPTYFKSVFAYLYAKLASQATPGETSALRLRFVDATLVSLSAKLLTFGLRTRRNRSRKVRRQIKSVLELSSEGLPNLLHLCREMRETSDCLALGLPMEQATQAGGFWLTPHARQSYRVLRVVKEQTGGDRPASPPQGEAAFHLLRVEQVIFENCRNDPQALRQRLQKMPVLVLHGLRYDVRSQQWKPLVLMSNLPLSEDGTQAGPYPFLELAQLYRRRWEIEVFFKFLKMHLGYRHLSSRTENGIQVMRYMSLIGALLLIWYKRQTGIDRGWKSVEFWFAEDARLWTHIALQKVSLQSG